MSVTFSSNSVSVGLALFHEHNERKITNIISFIIEMCLECFWFLDDGSGLKFRNSSGNNNNTQFVVNHTFSSGTFDDNNNNLTIFPIGFSNAKCRYHDTFYRVPCNRHLDTTNLCIQKLFSNVISRRKSVGLK